MGPCTHSARKLLRFVPCLAPAATALLMLRMWMSARRLPSVEAGDGAVRPSQQSRTSPEKLAEDPQCAAGAVDGGEAVGGGERYLLYQPQFGLSNQIVALRNAVVWALLLNRTLVLPHLLGHGTAQLMAAHSDAFDVAAARVAVAPTLRVTEMDGFLRLGLAPRRVLVLDINIKMRGADDAYFDRLGVSQRTRGPPRRVAMPDFAPASIVAAFGACARHRALAFRSLFAALDVKPKDYPPPGMSWLNRQAMPSLLRPARTPAQASSAKRSGSAAHRPARRLTPLPAPLSGQPRSPLSSI